MITEISKELFKESEARFAEHLALSDNYRIVFSGRFGMGKSTFISSFFNNSPKYNAIHLYPVNYSVSSNADIFKYIKYDILVEMIINNYPIQAIQLSKWQTFHRYLSENGIDLSSKIGLKLVEFIPLIGKNIADLAEPLVHFLKEFPKFHQEKNIETTESELIKDFLKEIEKTKGSIYETGLEIDLIEELLCRNKEKDKKENVLIIDDLDRIDPDHIFRILNIFAAHLDDQKSESWNKFGFDKIILICDIDNVRSIFEHRYGGTVDFNGYIDKFYSLRIFEYITRTGLRKFLRDRLLNIEWVSEKGREASHTKSVQFDDEGFIVFFLMELCYLGLVNLRNIVKWSNTRFSYSDQELLMGRTIHIHPISPLLSMRFLTDFFGGKSSLESVVRKIEKISFNFKPDLLQRFCFDLINEMNGEPIQREQGTIDFLVKEGNYRMILNKGQFKCFNILEKKINSLREVDFGIDILKSCLLLYIEKV
jgi:hypothetical protein